MDYGKVRTVLLRVLLLNIVVAALKVTVGIMSGSVAVLTDGVHSFLDGFANIVGLVGIHFAKKPKDATHPYGYTKYETLAALGISTLILIAAYEMGREIVVRALNPVSPEMSVLYVAVLGAALVIDFAVSRYEYRAGKKLQSKLIVADARHTATHLFTTSAVLAGAGGMMLGFDFVDIIIAPFVWFMMMKFAWVIFKDVRGVLTDSVLLDPARVKEIAERVGGVRESHDIRSRGDRHAGFIEMHIVVDPSCALEEAHRISHEVREKIMKEIKGVTDVIVHIEPEKQK